MLAKPILFLDFDGVLHSLLGQDELFSAAPLLGKVLFDADIDVVISSDWRLKHSVFSLKSMLPTEIASRVIDMTGWHPHGRYRRYREILMWLAATNRLRSPWVALDDSLAHFPPKFGGLIWCRPRVGFSEQEARALATWISRPKAFARAMDEEWHQEDLTRMTRQELSELLRWLRTSGHEDRFDLEKYLDRVTRGRKDRGD